ncbi:sulfide:quinone oxidoreductase, mitochondrial-like [Penaeus chinensis]|uniref:sulfide:quinone oxidoreductase, mitochondrial-like n=1 Tax=Penaeus chinensis TaxID=139456 RepID=UPI001FB573F6|nr:sulfide:quinone oxidoreductase, mitochondrial-like [Penaeus chinensis]XP_047501362.1 sulfide:quinone oxidoreductase, mitochondrial-like [Penaeus chinensis]XP_047501363.1 sulfide:quinone oxidoreductase, mitochondrial-like [Penaeus chinensis]
MMLSRSGALAVRSSCLVQQTAALSTSSVRNKSYELVVVGGGAGGCATAAKFSSKLGKGKVAVIEPADMHYYQPMWTLVGGGMKTLENSGKPMSKVLPKKADWIKQRVVAFDPANNKVMTDDGQEINYQYLVVALGLQLNYNKIKGLPEAFETPGVGSNYSPLYVNKTFESLRNFKQGNAIFTFPATPIKCAGAPQKIMYIADEYLRKNGKRDKANILFNTSLGVIFGVKKYAEVLWEVVKERDLTVNLRHNLVEVKPDSREAVFQNLDNPEEFKTFEYEMLHVTPPMSSPDVLNQCTSLVDGAGYLNVKKDTMQHVDFPNVFGIGDCTSLPTSKTAAAVAGQVGVLRKNLSAVMAGKNPDSLYDGYTSCPLVTGYSKCILAEFDYDGNPLETFPINQAKERRTMFHLKKDFMPDMYWLGLLNGYWEGPKYFRKAMHLGLK